MLNQGQNRPQQQATCEPTAQRLVLRAFLTSRRACRRQLSGRAECLSRGGGGQPSVAAQAANPNGLNGMLLRHAEALRNKGQNRPQPQATFLPDMRRSLSQAYCPIKPRPLAVRP